MKSLTAVCQTGASMPAMKPQSGRVSRPPQHRGNGENAEMRMYLSKLKDLVPFMPKNRKLSKLEIIQHVIDYICELQTELESHPDIDSYDGARELLATPNRHFALDLVNQAAAAAAVAGDHEEADDEDEQDMIMDNNSSSSSTTTNNNNNNNNNINNNNNNDNINERLTAADGAAANQQQQQQQQQQQHYQQQQQTSPAARQPLVDRNAPNTFLPANANMQLQQNNTATASSSAAAATATSIAPTAVTITTTPSATQQSTLIMTAEKDQSRRNC